jgi:hypothetical protein
MKTPRSMCWQRGVQGLGNSVLMGLRLLTVCVGQPDGLLRPEDQLQGAEGTWKRLGEYASHQEEHHEDAKQDEHLDSKNWK